MKRIALAILLVAVTANVFAKGSSGFGLTVLVDDSARPEFQHNGSVYIEAVKGSDFELRITNPTGDRVAVALSVDGLNTIDAKHTDARSASKWVLGPYESTTISGWQVSDMKARRFFFTGERHSYGAALGQTQNLGVIEAVYYRERRRPVLVQPMEREESAMPAPSANSAGAGRSDGAMPRKAAASDDYAATGMGKSTRHEIENVDIDLEPTPIASVRIRYEFHPQLVKLGVLPARRDPMERREHASGFAYCPEAVQ